MSDAGYESTSWFQSAASRADASVHYAGDVLPQEAWDILKDHPEALLIDVRSEAEWHFVGVPDLSSLGKEVQLIEWSSYPSGQPNPNFMASLDNSATKDVPLLFLCRVGGRSRAAADIAAQHGYVVALNILDGFDGPRDASHQRGALSGWRAAGLPWVQS